MAEPLEQVVTAIAGRRGRIRPWEQNAFLGDTGMRSQAISDAAQGVDISSAAPNTRLRARQGEIPQPAEEEAPAPKEQEARNPFQFAAMREEDSPCANGMCGQRAQSLNPFMPMQQQAMPMAAPARQLPPGVVLGPGETLDWDSVREVPTASAPQATVSQSRPAAPPAAATQESDGGLPPLTVPQQFYDAQQHIAAAETAGSPHQALVNLKLAGQSNLIGTTAVKIQMLERANAAADRVQKQYYDLAKGRNDALVTESQNRLTATRTEAGYPDLGAYEAIRGMQASPSYKAQLLVQTRMNTMKNVAMSKDDVVKLYDQEFGQMTALDAAKLLPTVVHAKSVMESNGDPAEYGRAVTAVSSFQQMLHDRYGDIADPAQRRIKITNELRPVFVDKFMEMHTASGMSVDRAERQSQFDANDWIKQSIAAVESQGRAGRAPPRPVLGTPRQESAVTPSPARPTSPAPATQSSDYGFDVPYSP